ncbi:MAG TPA: hypothetical protein DCQ93_10010 [Bacteroidetes bacterium]|nr:hypothetical protein [Bacteroidota bacterium]
MIIEKQVVLNACLFPKISWFQKAVRFENVLLSEEEKYRKENHPNRYSIAAAGGRIELTVPLSGGRNQKSKMNKLVIANDLWKRKHWQTIQSSYGKAPYYLYYADAIHEVIFSNTKEFSDLCLKSIQVMGKEMKLKTKFSITHEIAGVSLIDNTETPIYPQVFSDRNAFQKDLSVIDLLFNTGPDSLNYL